MELNFTNLALFFEWLRNHCDDDAFRCPHVVVGEGSFMDVECTFTAHEVAQFLSEQNQMASSVEQSPTHRAIGERTEST